MENKNLGIVITIVTTFLCGLPGLISMCSGVVLAFSNPEFNDPVIGVFFSLSLLCTGLIFVAIPIVAAYFTFRNRSRTVKPPSGHEPIPPPS
jgi:hypothetical protein